MRKQCFITEELQKIMSLIIEKITSADSLARIFGQSKNVCGLSKNQANSIERLHYRQKTVNQNLVGRNEANK